MPSAARSASSLRVAVPPRGPPAGAAGLALPPPPLTPLMLTAPPLAAAPADRVSALDPRPSPTPPLPAPLPPAAGLAGASAAEPAVGVMAGPAGGAAGAAGAADAADVVGDGSVRRSLRAQACGLASTRRRRKRK